MPSKSVPGTEKAPRRGPVLAMSAVALVAVAACVVGQRRTPHDDVPPEAAAWFGAMSLYRTIAVWAGKRAMSAEMSYWKATAR